MFDTAVSEIIQNRLYLTSLAGSKKALNDLDLNIDIVVSILDFDPYYKIKLLPKYAHIKFIFYEAADEENFKITKYFEDFHKILDENPNAKVLVHCLAGISRSATLVMSYVIKLLVESKRPNVMKKYDVERVLKLIKKNRNCVCPNNGFIKELEVFREEIIKKNSEVCNDAEESTSIMKHVE